MIYLMALIELYNTSEHGDAYHHVAGCFLDNIHTVGDMSVSELAELCNVSVATITRFFRKMSFPPASGMSYVMHAIRDARLFEGAFVPNEAQSPGGFGMYAASLKEGIDKLTASIDPGVFEGAVSALCDARQVHFLAVPMVLDAFLLQAELVVEGVRTSAFLNPEHQIEAQQQFDEHSLAVIIHQRRQPGTYLDNAQRQAHERGSKTLVISNSPRLALCKDADYCLAFEGSGSLQDSMLCNVLLHMLADAYRRRVLR